MFLLNSRYPLFNDTFNTLFPEVTELICRVPSITLTPILSFTQLLILVLELVQLN